VSMGYFLGLFSLLLGCRVFQSLADSRAGRDYSSRAS
jgi:hypothetical protein